MLIRNFRNRLQSALRASWICVISCLTFLLMIGSISHFRDECFHAPLPPSENHILRCGTVVLRTEDSLVVNTVSSRKNSEMGVTKFSNNEDVGIILRDGENLVTSTRQTLLKRHEEVLEYFAFRRNYTKHACITMFRKEDEDEFQNRNDENQTPKSESPGSTHQSNVQMKNEGKFFMRATNPTRWIFFYKHNSTQLEMQWCPLYKSGSSSWMAVVSKLSGALSEITERKLRKGTITFMQLATNFRMFHSAAFVHLEREDKIKVYAMVIVRHPFKRILSAYRDKLETIRGREYYSNTIGNNIIKRFRQIQHMKPHNLRTIPITNLSHSNHTIVVINQKRSTTNKVMTFTKSNISQKRHYSNPRVPTFEEFCKYLISIDSATMNEHWRPQYLDCSPCHHNFDLILKVEESENDKIQVFKLLGLTNKTSNEYQEIDAVWKRWANRNSAPLNESFYFSQLSHSLIKQLFQLYEPDFKLFGYSPHEYFSMTK